MRVVSWFDAEPPGKRGERWINEYHIVGQRKIETRWLCDRRIDPKKEVDRRSHELASNANGVELWPDYPSFPRLLAH